MESAHASPGRPRRGSAGSRTTGSASVSYNLVSDALNGPMELKIMLLLLLLKVVATATGYGSGNAGGVFGPRLFIGAVLGGARQRGVHMRWSAWVRPSPELYERR